MANQFPRWPRANAIAALFLALPACSSPGGRTPDSDVRAKFHLVRPEFTQQPNAALDTTRALGADDFVGPDGQCPGDAVPAAGEAAPGALYFQTGPEADPTTAPARAPAAPGFAQPGSGQQFSGIALQMSECDLVRAIGHAGQVEISTNERGERSVVITYPQGDHPGIYRFASGRLKAIERAPESPAAARPAPAQKPRKKPAAS